jgi:hypothetical protein
MTVHDTYILIVCFCIIVLFSSCKVEPTQPAQSAGLYNQLLFEREGGGNLVFAITSISSTDSFQVNVTKISYRDTSIQRTIYRNSSTAGLFDTLVLALNGKIPLEGGYKPDSLPTGTWAFIYFVNEKGQKEITNESLRATLLKLEPMVLLECSSRNSSRTTPMWVIFLIMKFQSELVGNPPQSIWQYEYKDQIVYYVPPQCCDQYSVLYDSIGYVICAPDGGFTGTGDGNCPDFNWERKNGILIWQDSRTR